MKPLHHNQVLQAPITTEKSRTIEDSSAPQKRYTFKVHSKANKSLIRQALRYFYKVDVVKINIMNTAGKPKRFRRQPIHKPGFKKAIVTLVRGQSIEFVK